MKTFKKVILRIFIGLTILFVLFIGLFVLPYFTNTLMPWDKSNAIESTLTWGGLSQIPEDSDITSVEMNGNMFTRSYKVEFTCNQKELNNWILSSKGLKNLIPENQVNQILLYQIDGYEGSIGGTVKIDKERNIVYIDMHWS